MASLRATLLALPVLLAVGCDQPSDSGLGGSPEPGIDLFERVVDECFDEGFELGDDLDDPDLLFDSQSCIYVYGIGDDPYVEFLGNSVDECGTTVFYEVIEFFAKAESYETPRAWAEDAFAGYDCWAWRETRW